MRANVGVMKGRARLNKRKNIKKEYMIGIKGLSPHIYSAKNKKEALKKYRNEYGIVSPKLLFIKQKK